MPQNARDTYPSADPQTSVEPYKIRAFDQYLTFCALGGMVLTDIGGWKIMTLGQFCAEIGIDEKTTWRWKTQIPDFAMRVRQRREEIVPLARETAAWNRLFMIGTSSIPTGTKEVVNKKTGAVKLVRTGALHDDQKAAVQALTTYLGHFGELKTPTQRKEVKLELNSWAELVQAKQGVIEGEVVDNADTDTDQPG